jgi:hypothetical protein
MIWKCKRNVQVVALVIAAAALNCTIVANPVQIRILPGAEGQTGAVPLKEYHTDLGNPVH